MRHLLCLLTVAALLGCSSEERLIVGSKNFSENVFLAELVAQHVEATTDIPVERRLNLGGTFICHQALLVGEIDLYPEYTGTALTSILEAPIVKDRAGALASVREQYEQRFDATWAAPFGFEDTYAILVRDADAPDDLRTISDLARYTDAYTIGFNFEFIEREDGWRGFQRTYDLAFEKEPVTMDLSLVYQGLAERRIDVAVGNSTHGLIPKLGLRQLDDDRRYFPPYDAAAIVRQDAFARFPGLEAALAELDGKIDGDAMREINRRLDVELEPVEAVARDFRERVFGASSNGNGSR